MCYRTRLSTSAFSFVSKAYRERNRRGRRYDWLVVSGDALVQGLLSLITERTLAVPDWLISGASPQRFTGSSSPPLDRN